MFIIGLIGNKRVGKDTVANILKDYYPGNSNITTYALADPIKDIARIMFNFTDDQLYGPGKDVLDTHWNIKPRDFFEQFGTEIMQYDIYKYLPNLGDKVPQRKFWVYSLLNKLAQNHSSDDGGVIITDVRGMHELEEIKRVHPNAKFIKITRPGITSGTHITQLEPYQIPESFIDAVIHNDGSLEDLKNKVEKVMEKL